jgi:hypothetical protein
VGEEQRAVGLAELGLQPGIEPRDDEGADAEGLESLPGVELRAVDAGHVGVERGHVLERGPGHRCLDLGRGLGLGRRFGLGRGLGLRRGFRRGTGHGRRRCGGGAGPGQCGQPNPSRGSVPELAPVDVLTGEPAAGGRTADLGLATSVRERGERLDGRVAVRGLDGEPHGQRDPAGLQGERGIGQVGCARPGKAVAQRTGVVEELAGSGRGQDDRVRHCVVSRHRPSLRVVGPTSFRPYAAAGNGPAQ